MQMIHECFWIIVVAIICVARSHEHYVTYHVVINYEPTMVKEINKECISSQANDKYPPFKDKNIKQKLTFKKNNLDFFILIS